MEITFPLHDANEEQGPIDAETTSVKKLMEILTEGGKWNCTECIIHDGNATYTLRLDQR